MEAEGKESHWCKQVEFEIREGLLEDMQNNVQGENGFRGGIAYIFTWDLPLTRCETGHSYSLCFSFFTYRLESTNHTHPIKFFVDYK